MSMDVRCVCGWLRPTPYHAGEFSVCPACGRPVAPAGAVIHQAAAGGAAVLALLGLLTIGPAAWHIVAALTREADARASRTIPAWAHWSILLGVIELSFAIFVAQVRTWISLRSAAGMLLMAAAAHATLLGGTLMGGAWAHRVLQIATPLPGQQGPQLNAAAAWNLLLLTLAVTASVWLAWRGHLARCEAHEQTASAE